MTNVQAAHFQIRKPRMDWRINAGVCAILFLLTVLIPAILTSTVGLDGYVGYLVLVLVPSLLAGTLVIEFLFPRFVNAFALRRAGSNFTPTTMRTASRAAWIADAALRGSIATLATITLIVFDIPIFIQRIGVTVIVIMLFFGLLNLVRGARLGREIEAGASNLARQLALQEIQQMAGKGRRPRDWEPELIQQCLDPADASIWEIQGLLLAYYHAIDSQCNEDAQTAIQRATEIAQPLHAPFTSVVWHEAAFIAAWLHADPEVARGCTRFLRRSKRSIDDHTRHRIEAAILLAERDNEGARREIQRGLAALATASDLWIAQLDENLLHLIATRIGG